MKETKDKSIVISRVLCGGAADKSSKPLAPIFTLHSVHASVVCLRFFCVCVCMSAWFAISQLFPIVPKANWEFLYYLMFH